MGAGCNDCPGSVEQVGVNNCFKGTNSADPVFRIVLDMAFLEFEGIAVPEIIPDVFFVGQNLTYNRW